MKLLQTPNNKLGAFASLVLALVFAVSGFLVVQDDTSRIAAAVVVESANQLADTAVTAAIPATPAPAVDKPATDEPEEAEAKAKLIGTGEASFYGPGFAGRPTANGERFNPAEMTAAHRTLPFGSKLRVTNTRNGKTVVVRVNDRGPYAHNRVLDLSQGAAERIGMISSGTANVKIELIS